MPTIPCPTCDQPLLVTRAHAGRTMRCPGCTARVRVPSLAAAEGSAPGVDEARVAAEEIERAVGDRPRGVPQPQPPARAVARKAFVVIGVIAALALLLVTVVLSIFLG